MQTIYTQEQKELIKHFWLLNFKDLLVPFAIKRMIHKFFFLTFIGVIALSLLIYFISDDAMYGFYLFFIFIACSLWVVADLFYSSKCIYEILKLSQQYVDSNINLYDVLIIVGEDKTIKNHYRISK
jgi:hypothetical protein